jgi:hypothetical protein
MKLKVKMKDFEMKLLFVCAQRCCFRDEKKIEFCTPSSRRRHRFLVWESALLRPHIVDIGAYQGSHFLLDMPSSLRPSALQVLAEYGCRPRLSHSQNVFRLTATKALINVTTRRSLVRRWNRQGVCSEFGDHSSITEYYLCLLIPV